MHEAGVWKAAGDNDDGLSVGALHLGNKTSGHMRFARRFPPFNLGSWCGIAYRVAVCADIGEEIMRITGAQAAFEKMIPEFEPIAAPQTRGERASVVRCVEQLLVEKRDRADWSDASGRWRAFRTVVLTCVIGNMIAHQAIA